ncbi:MAG: hypothetical protein PHO03_04750, partial [Candidatus Omnitrophica bacterium]|nr:hypothetical protein [Candidatus Omnitrophota bacterium]
RHRCSHQVGSIMEETTAQTIIQLPDGFNAGALFGELLHLAVPFIEVSVIVCISFLVFNIIKKECK